MAKSRKYPFATAKNGNTKKWKHEELKFREIQKYLNVDRRINLTLDEYKNLEKDEKAKVKNSNPAFLGGYFEGRRTSVSMKTRSIVALDIDKKFPSDFSEFMQEHSPYPYHIYETLSSTKKHRKYRVLFFLSEDIDAEVYEPVARRIAATLRIIDFVDHTCYRKTQLMYAPIFCSDVVEPLNEFIGNPKEPNISAAEIIASFENIYNIAEWDAGKDEGALRKQNNMTLIDPRDKKGVIGAFCNYVGDIHNAIAMYDLPYRQESDDRYSFTGGSSSNGFVVYDDAQWGYSNHESDPAGEGGHDLNAFDLVRVHKFGERDRKDGYKDPTRAPSYKAMVEMLMSDNEFAKILDEQRASNVLDRIFDAESDFGDVFEEEDQPDVKLVTSETKASKRRIVINGKSYRKNPAKDKRLGKKLRKFETRLIKSGESGLPVNNKTNVYRAVREHPLLEDRILYDNFTRRLTFVGVKPWPTTEGDAWNENDDFMLATFLESHDLKVPVDTVRLATQQVSQEPQHQFNSLANFFKYHLPEWDGVERVETMFTDAFNAEDNETNRMIARKTLLAGLERALNDKPSEVKAVPVLQGAQSVGKSTFWRLLAINREWFTDSKIDIGNKDGLSILGGTFIVEFGEFASIKRADRDEVKQFLSSSYDKYRPSYAKTERTFVRHNIFVGSVNDEEFLTDPTGNTRFKVVHCPGDSTGAARVVELMTPDYVLQLWAEAMAMRNAGETFLYTAKDDLATEQIAKRHTKAGTYDELIQAFVTAKKPNDWLMAVDDYEKVDILRKIVSGFYKDDELTIDPEPWFSARDLRTSLNIRDSDEPKYRQQIAAALRDIPGLKQQTRKIGGVSVRGYSYMAFND